MTRVTPRGGAWQGEEARRRIPQFISDFGCPGGSCGNRTGGHARAAYADGVAAALTATSQPLLYYKLLQRQLPLDDYGFVEEEFLISGRANVYDWPAAANQDLPVVYRDASYTYLRELCEDRRSELPACLNGRVTMRAPIMS